MATPSSRSTLQTGGAHDPEALPLEGGDTMNDFALRLRTAALLAAPIVLAIVAAAPRARI